MNLAVALRDARQTWRVSRAQAEVLARHRPTGTRWRSWPGIWSPRAAWMPWLVPLFTWLGLVQDSWLFAALAAWLVVFVGGRWIQFSLLRFTSVDVLRQPSLAGVVLLRLWRELPGMILLGGAWATAMAILLWDHLRVHPLGVVPMLLAVLLVMPLWTLCRARARLLNCESTVGPIAAVVLCAWLSWYLIHDPTRTWVDALGCVLIVPPGLLGAWTVVSSWRKEPLTRLRALFVDLGVLPRWIVALAVFALARSVDPGIAVGAPAWIFLGFLVVWTALALANLVAVVGEAEGYTPGAGIEAAEEMDPDPDAKIVAAPLPREHRGGPSPLAAAVYLERRVWFSPPGLGLVFRTLRHLWGLGLAAVAVGMTRGESVHLVLGLLAGFSASAILATAPSFGQRLLGVDYREQVRRWLWMTVACAVAPVVATAGIVGTLAGWSDPRVLVLGGIVASFALRLGWRGFTGVGEFGSMPSAVVVSIPVLLAAAAWAPLGPWWPPILASLFVLGLIGIGLRIRTWREPALADAAAIARWGET